MISVAVIGVGLIGRERLSAIASLRRSGRPVVLAGLYDANSQQAQKTANEFDTAAYPSLDALLAAQPDWVVVCLPHDAAVPIALRCLAGGAHVLLEKPMGRTLAEARQLFEAGGDRLHIGFNYRYFGGIRRALQDARAGLFGDLIGATMVLGHGGSPGQEKTWKLDPVRAGGGCLIDPGVHLLDLCHLLVPQGLDVAGAATWNGFWNTGVEEDVQLLLKGPSFAICTQISIVRWRSTFRFEVHGRDGYGVVTGRGRSYGPQHYRTGRRWGWQTAANQEASEIAVLEDPCTDSFLLEMTDLFWPNTEATAWPPPSTAAEALTVMETLDRIQAQLGLHPQID
jgi:predicted dehydrogenase